MSVFTAIANTFNYFLGKLLVGAQLGTTVYGTAAAYAAAAVATAAVVAGVSKGVTRALTPDIPGRNGLNPGVRVQLPPNPSYSVPICYGNVITNGIVTDAYMSSNSQQMTYVITLSEKTSGSTTLGNIYFNNKRLVFSGNETVTSTVDEDGTSSTDFAGNVKVWVWDGDGSSANTIQGSSTDAYNVVSGWANSDYAGSSTIFSVVQITFDPEAQLTGLGTMTYELNNSLNNPGNVIVDYLNSPIYGANISNSDIDMTSISTLSSYSDELISFVDKDGANATQKRYTINGVANTAEDIRTNLDRLLTACNSFFGFDVKQGKWKITPNKAVANATLANAFVANAENIIGSINFASIGLSDTINSIEAEYPDKYKKDQNNYVTIDYPSNLREANERDNQQKIRYEFVNNDVQAKYLANQELRQLREELVVNFTLDYTGLQLDAGDVIKLYEPDVYGQNNKEYRILKLVEQADDTGMIQVDVTAVEYNADVYTVEPITEFTPAPNSDIKLFNRLSAPSTPVVDNEQSLAGAPTFDVTTTMASSGIYNTVELWSSTDSGFASPKLLARKKTSTTFGTGTDVEFQIRGLDTGTYYYKAKAGNDRGISDFSTISSAHVWTANVQINPVTVIDSNDPVLDTSGNNIILRTGSISNTYLDANVVQALTDAGNIQINAVEGYFYFDSLGNTNAPSDVTFQSQTGRLPIENDIVVVTNSSNTEQQAGYVYTSGSFVQSTNFISGSIITDGTIGANKIVANSISTSELNFTPITEIAGQTGATISAAQLSSGGVRLQSQTINIGNSDVTGTLPVTSGGTGQTSTASYAADLSAAGLRLRSEQINIANADVTGTLPVGSGGTGQTSTVNYVAELSANGLRLRSEQINVGNSDVTGTMGEGNGGTGYTSLSSALTAQGVGFVSGVNTNLGDLAVLDNINLSYVTDSGSFAALNSLSYNDAKLTGTLDETNGGTGHTSDTAYVSHLTSQNLVLATFNGSPQSGGDLTAATVISAGSILVADANVSRNGNGGVTSITGDVITTGTLNASLVDVTNLNANNITAGTLDADRVATDDLVLPSNGADKTAIGPFHDNDLNYKHLGDIGSGAGFYTGYIRVYKGAYPGEVKTIRFLVDDGTHGVGGAYDVDTGSYFYDTTRITSASSHFVYETPLLQYLTGGLINESRLSSSADQDTANIPIAFKYSGTGTPKVFIYAQGDSNSQYIGGSEVHFVKFST